MDINRVPFVLIVALSLAAAALAAAGDAPPRCDPLPEPPLAPERPETYANTTPVERVRFFHAGLTAFTRVETPASGLGPVFNGTSCAACHAAPAVGGSSRTTVARFARTELRFDAMPERGGPLIQRHGVCTATCAVAGEVVPIEATRVSLRDTQPLFGLGLVDAVPDEHILVRADRLDLDRDGISGKPQFVNGRVGRFGWKAQIPTLAEFAAVAALNELGITSPALPAEVAPQGGPVVCDYRADPEDDGSHVAALTDFMSLLAPLPRRRLSTVARHGRTAFRRVGCTACHVPSLRTGPHVVRALGERRARIFSDLLLHDMGPELADGMEQGTADGAEFRTAPLMGVAHSAPYLHDGRAETLEAAIAAHGGEAARSRDRFARLSPRKQAALSTYLSTL